MVGTDDENALEVTQSKCKNEMNESSNVDEDIYNTGALQLKETKDSSSTGKEGCLKETMSKTGLVGKNSDQSYQESVASNDIKEPEDNGEFL